MAAILIVCSCGYPNAMGGPTESLLETIKGSATERKCGSCGATINNQAAFIGEWKLSTDGLGAVRVRKAATSEHGT